MMTPETSKDTAMTAGRKMITWNRTPRGNCCPITIEIGAGRYNTPNVIQNKQAEHGKS